MKKKWYKSELANLEVEKLSELEVAMLKHLFWTMKNAQVQLSIINVEESLAIHIYIYKDFIVVGHKFTEDESIIWVPSLPLVIGAIHGFFQENKCVTIDGKGNKTLQLKDVGQEVEEEVIRWLSYENKYCLEGVK